MNINNPYLSTQEQQPEQHLLTSDPTSVDNNRALWLARIRWIVIAIVMIIMASILLTEYNNENKNITIHTNIIPNITSIETPYFYFIVDSLSATNFTVEGIYSRKNSSYNLTIFNAPHFSYKACCDNNFAVVLLPHSFQTSNTSQILIIPPKKGKGSMINKGDMLYIYLNVTDNNLKPFEYPGIFWAVDSVADGIIKSLRKTDNNITDAIRYRFDVSPVSQHEFSAYNSYTMSALQVTYVINSWDEKWFGEKQEKIDNTYFTANVKASIPSWVEPDNFSHNLIHITDFAFYINPTGAGIQTNIIKEKDQYLFDTFGKIGGYFGPLVSTTSILLTIAVFGLPACGNRDPLFRGFAPKTGLSEIQQKQIQQYLKKLGV